MRGAISKLSGEELVGRLDDGRTFLLDVREPDEVADWAIPGVCNIPMSRLAARMREVPTDRPVVTICAVGSRAMRAARFLADAGVSCEVLEGGMTAWASTYDTVSAEFGDATVVQVRRRGKGCLSYVVGAGKRAIVIDPSLSIETYLDVARRHGWQICLVVDTHLHADHLSGARHLAGETGATLALNPDDPFAFGYEPLVDGQDLELAPGVDVSVSSLRVPGHTEGSTMFLLDGWAIFTGDTLFLESVGRPDLADQAVPYAHQLYRSIHERVMAFSDESLVFPAHYGPGVPVLSGQLVTRPLGELRTTLPALSLSEDEFVQWALAHVKDRPANYRRIVMINAGVRDIDPGAEALELGPNRCAIVSSTPAVAGP